MAFCEKFRFPLVLLSVSIVPRSRFTLEVKSSEEIYVFVLCPSVRIPRMDCLCYMFTIQQREGQKESNICLA